MMSSESRGEPGPVEQSGSVSLILDYKKGNFHNFQQLYGISPRYASEFVKSQSKDALGGSATQQWLSY